MAGERSNKFNQTKKSDFLKSDKIKTSSNLLPKNQNFSQKKVIDHFLSKNTSKFLSNQNDKNPSINNERKASVLYDPQKTDNEQNFKLNLNRQFSDVFSNENETTDQITYLPKLSIAPVDSEYDYSSVSNISSKSFNNTHHQSLRYKKKNRFKKLSPLTSPVWLFKFFQNDNVLKKSYSSQPHSPSSLSNFLIPDTIRNRSYSAEVNLSKTNTSDEIEKVNKNSKSNNLFLNSNNAIFTSNNSLFNNQNSCETVSKSSSTNDLNVEIEVLERAIRKNEWRLVKKLLCSSNFSRIYSSSINNINEQTSDTINKNIPYSIRASLYENISNQHLITNHSYNQYRANSAFESSLIDKININIVDRKESFESQTSDIYIDQCRRKKSTFLNSILHLAIEFSSFDVVCVLLKNGFNANNSCCKQIETTQIDPNSFRKLSESSQESNQNQNDSFESKNLFCQYLNKTSYSSKEQLIPLLASSNLLSPSSVIMNENINAFKFYSNKNRSSLSSDQNSEKNSELSSLGRQSKIIIMNNELPYSLKLVRIIPVEKKNPTDQDIKYLIKKKKINSKDFNCCNCCKCNNEKLNLSLTRQQSKTSSRKISLEAMHSANSNRRKSSATISLANFSGLIQHAVHKTMPEKNRSNNKNSFSSRQNNPSNSCSVNNSSQENELSSEKINEKKTDLCKDLYQLDSCCCSKILNRKNCCGIRYTSNRYHCHCPLIELYIKKHLVKKSLKYFNQNDVDSDSGSLKNQKNDLPKYLLDYFKNHFINNKHNNDLSLKFKPDTGFNLEKKKFENLDDFKDYFFSKINFELSSDESISSSSSNNKINYINNCDDYLKNELNLKRKKNTEKKLNENDENKLSKITNKKKFIKSLTPLQRLDYKRKLLKFKKKKKEKNQIELTKKFNKIMELVQDKDETQKNINNNFNIDSQEIDLSDGSELTDSSVTFDSDYDDDLNVNNVYVKKNISEINSSNDDECLIELDSQEIKNKLDKKKLELNLKKKINEDADKKKILNEKSSLKEKLNKKSNTSSEDEDEETQDDKKFYSTYEDYYTKDVLYLLPPIFLAVVKGNVPIVKELIRFGANVNATDANGTSPLHLLFCQKNFNYLLANVLLANGAKLSATNSAGVTPIDLALNKGNELISLQRKIVMTAFSGLVNGLETLCNLNEYNNINVLRNQDNLDFKNTNINNLSRKIANENCSNSKLEYVINQKNLKKTSSTSKTNSNENSLSLVNISCLENLNKPSMNDQSKIKVSQESLSSKINNLSYNDEDFLTQFNDSSNIIGDSISGDNLTENKNDNQISNRKSSISKQIQNYFTNKCENLIKKNTKKNQENQYLTSPKNIKNSNFLKKFTSNSKEKKQKKIKQQQLLQIQQQDLQQQNDVLFCLEEISSDGPSHSSNKYGSSYYETSSLTKEDFFEQKENDFKKAHIIDLKPENYSYEDSQLNNSPVAEFFINANPKKSFSITTKKKNSINFNQDNFIQNSSQNNLINSIKNQFNHSNNSSTSVINQSKNNVVKRQSLKNNSAKNFFKDHLTFTDNVQEQIYNSSLGIIENLSRGAESGLIVLVKMATNIECVPFIMQVFNENLNSIVNVIDKSNNDKLNKTMAVLFNRILLTLLEQVESCVDSINLTNDLNFKILFRKNQKNYKTEQEYRENQYTNLFNKWFTMNENEALEYVKNIKLGNLTPDLVIKNNFGFFDNIKDLNDKKLKYLEMIKNLDNQSTSGINFCKHIKNKFSDDLHCLLKMGIGCLQGGQILQYNALLLINKIIDVLIVYDVAYYRPKRKINSCKCLIHQRNCCKQRNIRKKRRASFRRTKTDQSLIISKSTQSGNSFTQSFLKSKLNFKNKKDEDDKQKNILTTSEVFPENFNEINNVKRSSIFSSSLFGLKKNVNTKTNINSFVNTENPKKALFSNFFSSNPKLKTNELNENKSLDNLNKKKNFNSQDLPVDSIVKRNLIKKQNSQPSPKPNKLNKSLFFTRAIGKLSKHSAFILQHSQHSSSIESTAEKNLYLAALAKEDQFNATKNKISLKYCSCKVELKSCIELLAQDGISFILNVLNNAITLQKRVIGSKQLCTPSHRWKHCTYHCLQILSARSLLYLSQNTEARKKLIEPAALKILLLSLDLTHDPQLLTIILQVIASIALDVKLQKYLLKAEFTDALVLLVLPSDKWFNTNYSTKYSKYIKHHAARILIYLGLEKRLRKKVNLFDIIEETLINENLISPNDFKQFDLNNSKITKTNDNKLNINQNNSKSSQKCKEKKYSNSPNKNDDNNLNIKNENLYIFLTSLPPLNLYSTINNFQFINSKENFEKLMLIDILHTDETTNLLKYISNEINFEPQLVCSSVEAIVLQMLQNIENRLNNGETEENLLNINKNFLLDIDLSQLINIYDKIENIFENEKFSNLKKEIYENFHQNYKKIDENYSFVDDNLLNKVEENTSIDFDKQLTINEIEKKRQSIDEILLEKNFLVNQPPPSIQVDFISSDRSSPRRSSSQRSSLNAEEDEEKLNQVKIEKVLKNSFDLELLKEQYKRQIDFNNKQFFFFKTLPICLDPIIIIRLLQHRLFNSIDQSFLDKNYKTKSSNLKSLNNSQIHNYQLLNSQCDNSRSSFASTIEGNESFLNSSFGGGYSSRSRASSATANSFILPNEIFDSNSNNLNQNLKFSKNKIQVTNLINSTNVENYSNSLNDCSDDFKLIKSYKEDQLDSKNENLIYKTNLNSIKNLNNFTFLNQNQLLIDNLQKRRNTAVAITKTEDTSNDYITSIYRKRKFSIPSSQFEKKNFITNERKNELENININFQERKKSLDAQTNIYISNPLMYHQKRSLSIAVPEQNQFKKLIPTQKVKALSNQSFCNDINTQCYANENNSHSSTSENPVAKQLSISLHSTSGFDVYSIMNSLATTNNFANTIDTKHKAIFILLRQWVSVCSLDFNMNSHVRKELKDFLNKVSFLGQQYQEIACEIKKNANLDKFDEFDVMSSNQEIKINKDYEMLQELVFNGNFLCTKEEICKLTGIQLRLNEIKINSEISKYSNQKVNLEKKKQFILNKQQTLNNKSYSQSSVSTIDNDNYSKYTYSKSSLNQSETPIKKELNSKESSNYINSTGSNSKLNQKIKYNDNIKNLHFEKKDFVQSVGPNNAFLNLQKIKNKSNVNQNLFNQEKISKYELAHKKKISHISDESNIDQEKNDEEEDNFIEFEEDGEDLFYEIDEEYDEDEEEDDEDDDDEEDEDDEEEDEEDEKLDDEEISDWDFKNFGLNKNELIKISENTKKSLLLEKQRPNYLKSDVYLNENNSVIQDQFINQINYKNNKKNDVETKNKKKRKSLSSLEENITKTYRRQTVALSSAASKNIRPHLINTKKQKKFKNCLNIDTKRRRYSDVFILNSGKQNSRINSNNSQTINSGCQSLSSDSRPSSNLKMSKEIKSESKKSLEVDKNDYRPLSASDNLSNSSNIENKKVLKKNLSKSIDVLVNSNTNLKQTNNHFYTKNLNTIDYNLNISLKTRDYKHRASLGTALFNYIDQKKSPVVTPKRRGMSLSFTSNKAKQISSQVTRSLSKQFSKINQSTRHFWTKNIIKNQSLQSTPKSDKFFKAQKNLREILRDSSELDFSSDTPPSSSLIFGANVLIYPMINSPTQATLKEANLKFTTELKRKSNEKSKKLKSSYSKEERKHLKSKITIAKNILKSFLSLQLDQDSYEIPSKNLKKYLPAYYKAIEGMDKSLKEHKRKLFHSQIYDNPLELKKLFIQTCKRSPFYGCEIFEVKEVIKTRTRRKKILRVLALGSDRISLFETSNFFLTKDQLTTDLIEWRTGAGSSGDRIVLKFNSCKWSLLACNLNSINFINRTLLAIMMTSLQSNSAFLANLLKCDERLFITCNNVDDESLNNKKTASSKTIKEKSYNSSFTKSQKVFYSKSTYSNIDFTYSEELELLYTMLHFPEEVALRLAEADHELFYSVEPVNYIRHITSCLLNDDKIAENELNSFNSIDHKLTVKDIVARFNGISSWVTHLIIVQPTHDDRKAVLSCLIRVAQSAWNMGAFNTSMQIISGLKCDKIRPFMLCIKNNENPKHLNFLIEALLFSEQPTNTYSDAVQRAFSIRQSLLVPFFGNFIKELYTVFHTMPSFIVKAYDQSIVNQFEDSLIQSFSNLQIGNEHQLDFIFDYNGQDHFMSRICVGNLINIEKMKVAEKVLKNLSLFHIHAIRRKLNLNKNGSVEILNYYEKLNEASKESKSDEEKLNEVKKIFQQNKPMDLVKTKSSTNLINNLTNNDSMHTTSKILSNSPSVNYSKFKPDYKQNEFYSQKNETNLRKNSQQTNEDNKFKKGLEQNSSKKKMINFADKNNFEITLKTSSYEDNNLYEIDYKNNYLSIQPLNYRHGVSFIPLNGEHFYSNINSLQLMHHGSTCIHYEEDTNRLSIVYLQLEQSNSVLAWTKPPWSALRKNYSNNFSFVSSVNENKNQSSSSIPNKTLPTQNTISQTNHFMSTSSFNQPTSSSSGSANDYNLQFDIEERVLPIILQRFSNPNLIAINNLDEGYLDLFSVKYLTYNSINNIDFNSLCKKVGLCTSEFNQSKAYMLCFQFGTNLTDNRKSLFIMTNKVGKMWSEGLTMVFKQLKMQRSLVDQRVNWLKFKYLQMFYEGGFCKGPSNPQAINLFGGRRWQVNSTTDLGSFSNIFENGISPKLIASCLKDDLCNRSHPHSGSNHSSIDLSGKRTSAFAISKLRRKKSTSSLTLMSKDISIKSRASSGEELYLKNMKIFDTDKIKKDNLKKNHPFKSSSPDLNCVISDYKSNDLKQQSLNKNKSVDSKASNSFNLSSEADQPNVSSECSTDSPRIIYTSRLTFEYLEMLKRNILNNGLGCCELYHNNQDLFLNNYSLQPCDQTIQLSFLEFYELFKFFFIRFRKDIRELFNSFLLKTSSFEFLFDTTQSVDDLEFLKRNNLFKQENSDKNYKYKPSLDITKTDNNEKDDIDFIEDDVLDEKDVKQNNLEKDFTCQDVLNNQKSNSPSQVILNQNDKVSTNLSQKSLNNVKKIKDVKNQIDSNQTIKGVISRNSYYADNDNDAKKRLQIIDAIATASILNNCAGLEIAGRILNSSTTEENIDQTNNLGYLTFSQFCYFLIHYQKEEITENYVIDLINRHEPDLELREKKCLSFEGFNCYLMDKENNAFIPHLNTCKEEDMDYPLSHYYIATSHNTYLTWYQFKGESSPDMYKEVLLTGCRCVELDCYDGEDGMPMIYHGRTFTTKISFKSVVETINKYAFVISPYPVILSIENHCSIHQQVKMAEIFKEIFKEKLVTDFLFESDYTDNPSLPSPNQLKYRILLKNKKLRSSSFLINNQNIVKTSLKQNQKQQLQQQQQSSPLHSFSPTGQSSSIGTSNKSLKITKPKGFSSDRANSLVSAASTVSLNDDDEEYDEDEEFTAKSIENQQLQSSNSINKQAFSNKSTPIKTIKSNSQGSYTLHSSQQLPKYFFVKQNLSLQQPKLSTHTKVTRKSSSLVAPELSDLVIYCQAIKFRNVFVNDRKNFFYYSNLNTSNDNFFANPTSKFRQPNIFASCFQVASLSENYAKKISRKCPTHLTNYNLNNLLRVYPAPTRLQSSNFNPIYYWAFGFQLVALNYQTDDQYLAINQAMFESTNSCGYVLKPKVMRLPDHLLFKKFNPLDPRFDGFYGTDITFKIISGLYVCPDDFNCCPFIELEVIGLDSDCQRQRTKIVQKNSINPVWNDTFVFKVSLIELAFLRFSVYDFTTNHLHSQRTIPLKSIRPGYRNVQLRNLQNQPLNLSSIFIYSSFKEETCIFDDKSLHFIQNFDHQILDTPMEIEKSRYVIINLNNVNPDEISTLLKIPEEAQVFEIILLALHKHKQYLAYTHGGNYLQSLIQVEEQLLNVITFKNFIKVLMDFYSTFQNDCIIIEETQCQSSQSFASISQLSQKNVDNLSFNNQEIKTEKIQKIFDLDDKPLKGCSRSVALSRKFIFKKISDDPNYKSWYNSFKNQNKLSNLTINKKYLDQDLQETKENLMNRNTNSLTNLSLSEKKSFINLNKNKKESDDNLRKTSTENLKLDKTNQKKEKISDFESKNLFLACIFNVNYNEPYTILKCNFNCTASDIINQCLIKSKRSTEANKKYCIVEELWYEAFSKTSISYDDFFKLFPKKPNKLINQINNSLSKSTSFLNNTNYDKLLESIDFISPSYFYLNSNYYNSKKNLFSNQIETSKKPFIVKKILSDNENINEIQKNWLKRGKLIFLLKTDAIKIPNIKIPENFYLYDEIKKEDKLQETIFKKKSCKLANLSFKKKNCENLLNFSKKKIKTKENEIELPSTSKTKADTKLNQTAQQNQQFFLKSTLKSNVPDVASQLTGQFNKFTKNARNSLKKLNRFNTFTTSKRNKD